jgi:poly(A) polymerase
MTDGIPATMPRAAWTLRADLAQLVAALGPTNIRWVGGAVRDTLLGDDVRDVDAATPFLPEEVILRLDEADIRTIPTGIDHGTVTAILPQGNVEITTLRHDVSTDGRRATIAYASDWRDDAARRDFTINALYVDPETLEIFDWFGGREDLAARRVRFIGDARDRIREDHLRILRYFRFQARFGAQLDDEAEAACRDLADTLKGLSRERVAMELLALLGLPDPSPTVARMADLGVLGVVMPETGKRELAVLASLPGYEQAEGASPDAIRRLAALVPPIACLAETVAARLRLSRTQRARLCCIAERKESDGIDPRGLAYRVGRECAIDRLLLTGRRTSALDGWEIPELPLKGGEIVASGVTAGPEVARILRQIEAQWIAEGFPGRERVEQMLAEIVDPGAFRF